MVHRPECRCKMESRCKVEHEMSLAALRRSDPYISGIVDVTGQVALYIFSAKANEWVSEPGERRSQEVSPVLDLFTWGTPQMVGKILGTQCIGEVTAEVCV